MNFFRCDIYFIIRLVLLLFYFFVEKFLRLYIHYCKMRNLRKIRSFFIHGFERGKRDMFCLVVCVFVKPASSAESNVRKVTTFV